MKQVWKAEDGKTFETEKECKDYEDYLKDEKVEGILEYQESAEEEYFERMRDLKGEEINGVTWGDPDPDYSDCGEEFHNRDPFEGSPN